MRQFKRGEAGPAGSGPDPPGPVDGGDFAEPPVVAGIAAVLAEAADAAPAGLVAVTTTRSAAPASASLAVYVRATAPETLLQLESQRCHWYEIIGPVPLQRPAEAVRTSPQAAVPEISGGVVLVGGTTAPTKRIRLFCSSAIRRSTAPVNPKPFGALSRAAPAGPPSPESPRVPSP